MTILPLIFCNLVENFNEPIFFSSLFFSILVLKGKRVLAGYNKAYVASCRFGFHISFLRCHIWSKFAQIRLFAACMYSICKFASLTSACYMRSHEFLVANTPIIVCLLKDGFKQKHYLAVLILMFACGSKPCLCTEMQNHQFIIPLFISIQFTLVT